VGNALKFTERGSVRIEIGTIYCALEIAVVDTGCGIAADQVERLFESFTQVQGSLTRAHAGTGLGLALSRKLARLLGGDVTVSTQIGVGSRFAVRLPIGQDYGLRSCRPPRRASSRRAIPRPRSRTTTRASAGRILLVEDGPDNQRPDRPCCSARARRRGRGRRRTRLRAGATAPPSPASRST
jgi:hypothetical protein